MATQRILVIDDDSDVGELIASAASGLGMHCIATTEAAESLDLLAPETTLIMLDLVMPAMDGVEVLRLLGQHQCKAEIVLMSGVGKRIIETAEELAQAHGLSIAGHLQKPFRLTELEAVLEKHRARIFDPPSARKAPLSIPDADLFRAIEQQEFVVYYQPQIDIRTGAAVGVEALVRWQHPQHGLVFPDSFVSRMESLGLIDRLGWFVAKQAMADVALFRGGDGETLSLSINVSAHSLNDLALPDAFSALAAKNGLPTNKVMLEITESSLLKELSRTLDILIRLRMMGVQLSIDDFGTGYSMMQQLRHIPATQLKIDRSFVQQMLDHEGDRVIVLKTIEIGHELQMKVIAEGVETRDQLEYLRSQRCDLAQGYLFSPPIPRDALIHWLANHNPAPANLT